MFLKPNPYRWRGKSYKTIGGLHTAMLKLHPHTALGFDADAVVLRSRDGSEVRYARTLPDNLIADTPTTGA